jgi:hypothetical protein
MLAGRLCLGVAVFSVAGLARADTFSIAQDKQFLQPYDSALLKTQPGAAGAAVTVTGDVFPRISTASIARSGSEFTYTAPNTAVGSCVQVAVTATTGDDKEPHSAHIVLIAKRTSAGFDVQEPCPGSLVNILDSRPLPIKLVKSSDSDLIYGPKCRWWGAIRGAVAKTGQ